MLRPSLRVLALAPLVWVLLAGCGNSSAPSAADISPASPTAAATTVSPAQPLIITVAENDGNDARSVELSVGQVVQVNLATCGGCGYEWTVDTDPAATVATSADPVAPTGEPTAAASGPPLPGAPTTTAIAFRAVGPGGTSITLGYHGPASTAPDRVVVVKLTVTG